MGVEGRDALPVESPGKAALRQDMGQELEGRGLSAGGRAPRAPEQERVCCEGHGWVGALSPERAVRREVRHRSLSLCLHPRLGAWISHFETHGTGSRHLKKT